jgi:hypothetical protein
MPETTSRVWTPTNSISGDAMGIHRGEPDNQAEFVITPTWTNTGKDGAWVAHRYKRRILRWFGLSWFFGGNAFFIGFMRFEGNQRRETIPEEPPR